MLATAQESIRRAAKDLGYSQDVIEAFLKPEQVHAFQVSSGKAMYPAYRVQHNNKLGPYKGGVRFHKGVTVDEVQALATLMSLKTAAVGLPLGGGKGGVVVDPRQLNAADIEAIARDYGRQLAPHIGSDKDIPGPDVNTNAQTMDWMVSGFEAAIGHKDPGSFTGKSIAAGGSEGRHPATGQGAAVVLREYLLANGLHNQPLTLALQGFGNAGYFFALAVRKECPNVTLIAVSNSQHTWLRPEGIDVTKVMAVGGMPRPEELTDAKQAKELSPAAIIGVQADILALAALEDAVNTGNAKSVRARHIIELANGPITDEAAAKLTDQNVSVIPDIVANAGGVIVSYLEWQQNLKGEHWSAAKVHKAMSEKLVAATKAMLARAKKRGITYKQAAFEIALQRLLG